jgi:peptidoglycan hydrolase CwlO-like protein
MGILDVGGVIIAIIAALGAWAAQRAAAKASTANTTVSGRLDAERGAYERARAFDVATIERQDHELKELREANKTLKEELAVVKARLAKLEQKVDDEPEPHTHPE